MNTLYFYITLTLLLPALCGGCPVEVQSLCGCVDELDGVILNCTSPAGGAPELVALLRGHQSQLGLIKSLTIRNARLATLPSHFFSGLYIKRLEMREAGLQAVEGGAFTGLEQVLQDISLADNQLRELPVPALSTMGSLLKLDLSNNSIGELQAEDALPRLVKLFDINLANNKISALHKTFFDNVKGSLQTINLVGMGS